MTLFILFHAAVTIGLERVEYSLSEGLTLSLCVVLSGAFDESPSVTVSLETSDSGSATGNIQY